MQLLQLNGIGKSHIQLALCLLHADPKRPRVANLVDAGVTSCEVCWSSLSPDHDYG